MRTIKFRGKRIKDGRWVYGYLSGACQITTTLQSSDGNAVHLVKRETIGQFTGLFDKNRNEIYEGDLIFCGDEESFECMIEEGMPDFFEVRFDERANGYNSFPIWNDEEHMEKLIKHFGGMITWPRDRVLSNHWHYSIVGNIHDQSTRNK